MLMTDICWISFFGPFLASFTYRETRQLIYTCKLGEKHLQKIQILSNDLDQWHTSLFQM